MLKLAALGLVIFALIGGGYFFFRSNLNSTIQTKNKPLEKISLRLAWLHQAQFAGFYVAQEKGFYKEAGLEVTLKEFEENLNNIDELVNGDVDFSLVSPLEAITSVNGGKKVKAIGVVYQTSPLAFASLKATNIKSPADFKGKILGAKGGNQESKIKYRAILQSFDLKESDVTIKDADYSVDEAEDLTSHRVDLIDLYRTDQPYLMTQKGVDFELLLPEHFGFVGYGDTLVTTDQLIVQNPKLVKNFVQASFKGWEYTLTHPEEALEITKKYENKDYTDPKREKHILEQSIPLIQPTGGNKVGHMDFSIWNQIAKQAESSELIKKNFDVTQVFTNEFNL